MTKAVLFDIDGVILPKDKQFDQKYSEEFEVDLQDIKLFFKSAFVKCQKGEADIKEALKPYLKKWSWQGNADDFLEYWFSTTTEADEDVLKIVDKLREFGIECHIASNQEKYRGEFLLEGMRFADYFDEVFFSYDLKVTKKDIQFFEYVVNVLGIKPAEIMFFDHDPKVVELAKKIGIEAYLYEDIDTLKKYVRPLLAN